MLMSECLDTDEIFTHIEDGTGVVRHINASAMWRGLSKYSKTSKVQKLRVEIDPEFIRFVRVKRGVERKKLDRLTDPYLHQPALGVWMDNGESCLTVDGHHRIVRLHELGEKEYDIFIFSHDSLDEFCVTDIPAKLDAMLTDATIAQQEQAEFTKRIERRR